MPYDDYDVVDETEDHVVVEKSPEDGPVERVTVPRDEYESDESEEVYECDKCDYSTDSQKGLSVHVAQSHDDSE